MAKKIGKKAARSATRTRPMPRTGKRSVSSRELIISKNRTKAAASMNVASDFYGALDRSVRALIRCAEQRAANNGRRTLRPHDL